MLIYMTNASTSNITDQRLAVHRHNRKYCFTHNMLKKCAIVLKRICVYLTSILHCIKISLQAISLQAVYSTSAKIVV